MESTAAESMVVETGVTEKKEEGSGLCFQQKAPGGSLVESLSSHEMGLALFGLDLGMQLVPLTRQKSAESLWQFALPFLLACQSHIDSASSGKFVLLSAGHGSPQGITLYPPWNKV